MATPKPSFVASSNSCSATVKDCPGSRPYEQVAEPIRETVRRHDPLKRAAEALLQESFELFLRFGKGHHELSWNAFRPPKSRKRFYRLPDLLFRNPQLIQTLQIQPKLRTRPKEMPEP